MIEYKSLYERLVGPFNGQSLFERVFGVRRVGTTPPAPARLHFCGNCARLEATFNRSLGALRDTVAAYGRLEDELRARLAAQAEMLAVLDHEIAALKKRAGAGADLTIIEGDD